MSNGGKKPIVVKEISGGAPRPDSEVNISSYPATSVAGSFFFRRAEISNSQNKRQYNVLYDIVQV